MTSVQSGAILHAVSATGRLTAAKAVAWFAATTPPGRQVIGYALSPRAAFWALVRPDGTIEQVASGATGGGAARPAGNSDPDRSDSGGVLAEAYELVFFDGDRELRWLRTPDGGGKAVALGEDPATLPPGEDVTAQPAHRRGHTQFRLLAGTASAHTRPRWTTLRGGRYATAHLPCQLPDRCDTLRIESVEYLVEDSDGNLDVADTRIVCLAPRSFPERTNR